MVKETFSLLEKHSDHMSNLGTFGLQGGRGLIKCRGQSHYSSQLCRTESSYWASHKSGGLVRWKDMTLSLRYKSLSELASPQG